MDQKITIASALEQVEEVNVGCATCTNVALEGEKYCMQCKIYWEDVDNGLWDIDG